MKFCPLCAECAPSRSTHCRNCHIPLMSRCADVPSGAHSFLMNAMLSIMLVVFAGLATCGYFWWLR